MPKKLRYYDENKRIIPYKKSLYQRNPHNGKWFLVSQEDGMTSRAIAKSEINAKVVLPFEDRHRKENRHPYRHDYRYDTITSYKGDKKSVMEFDFIQGDKNYRRLANKAHYDRFRYLKKKKGK